MTKRIILIILFFLLSFLPALYILFKTGFDDGYMFFLSLYFIYYNYITNGIAVLILIYYLIKKKVYFNITFFIFFSSFIFFILLLAIIIISNNKADGGVYFAFIINGVISFILFRILRAFYYKNR